MKITARQLKRIISEECAYLMAENSITAQDDTVWKLVERAVGGWVKGTYQRDDFDTLFVGSYDECVEQGHARLLKQGFEFGEFGDFADEGQFRLDDNHYLEIIPRDARRVGYEM